MKKKVTAAISRLKNAAQGASGRRVEAAKQQEAHAKRERAAALKQGRTNDASAANKAAKVAGAQYAAGSVSRALPGGSAKNVKKAMTAAGQSERRKQDLARRVNRQRDR